MSATTILVKMEDLVPTQKALTHVRVPLVGRGHNAEQVLVISKTTPVSCHKSALTFVV